MPARTRKALRSIPNTASAAGRFAALDSGFAGALRSGPDRPEWPCPRVNYLAHLLLAGPGDEARLGALLSDFVGSAALPAWPASLQREIRLHWRVDGETDRHPAVQDLRARFPDGRRRYAGIVLDVYFDHCLARDWARWQATPLEDFSARVYALLHAQHARLPAALQAMAPRMAAGDWLGGYRHREAVDRAVRGIATRLSRRGGHLVDTLATLRRHEAAADAAFEALFPDLQAFVATQRAATA